MTCDLCDQSGTESNPVGRVEAFGIETFVHAEGCPVRVFFLRHSDHYSYHVTRQGREIAGADGFSTKLAAELAASVRLKERGWVEA